MSADTQDPEVKGATFYIGLCMAGAVSAGAYTAGVIDFLLEALENWEKHRGETGVPDHLVKIPIMGGASAGGMTAIMTAGALNNPIVHIDKPGKDILGDHPENKLYHSWVDLTGKDMLSQMLCTNDVKKSPLKSALNAEFIDKVAARVLEINRDQWQPIPEFMHPDLKLFTTLSNLEGFDYVADFSATNPDLSKYHMAIHNDFACFQLTEEDIEGPNNGWMPLNIKKNQNIEVARDAAMATGAFPIGLKSRKLIRDALYVKNNKWLAPYLKGDPMDNGKYESLNVDGGMFNNEPFEKVRDILTDVTGQKEPADYNNFNTFESTVLMVEPFPTKKGKAISQKQDLLNVAGLTLSALLGQSRSKAVNISDALNPDCAGQYLITPSRRVTSEKGDEELTGERAIACGALSGFSGFISKEFRVHDYFLGRYNCKIFLRDYFTFPKSALDKNPIFRNGYAKADPERFTSKKTGSYQIIPQFEEVDYHFPEIRFNSGNSWPSVNHAAIDAYRGAIKKRAQAVLMHTVNMGVLTRFLLWGGAQVLLNRKLADAVISKIKSDLITWKLMTQE
jgi:Patatin-like phospholipase